MNLKDLFLLDPTVHFLNHGSFGATPSPVFAVYQEWQRRLEWQPVQFIAADLGDHLAAARQALGDYVNSQADDLVFVPNATFGVNVVARSLALGAGDEVLATDHEYGACDNIWRFLSQKQGFRYVNQPISLPTGTEEEIVAELWQGVTARTRVIFVSHITSATAVTFPIAAICARARAEGILTVVDGAHAPGQIPLDMAAIGADFYTGNCHKWLCAPKGSAFLYARPEVQHLIEPLVVGWGWGESRTLTFGSDFVDYLQWLGTMDPAAYLSVPAAIQFQAEHNWTAVRQQCHDLLRQTLGRIHTLTGLQPMYRSHADYCQMAIAALPPVDALQLKQRLLQEFKVEIPITEWHGPKPLRVRRHFVRVSVQGYNTLADMDALLAGLTAVMRDA
ncbi:MAG TPA: aminotransferase class V-fold PLP-dependent enzyme [Chloroflexota bacterium]|nr:aminotransferase class V-fold PLP-dependent enzyme [Chloroflexota bacterium]